MKNEIKFTYFPEWESKAALTQDKCTCQDELPCLEAIFFNDPDIEEPVCILDLVEGRIRVAIPDHLKVELDESIKSTFPLLDDQHRLDLLELRIEVLSRTPPVPWIQNNNWPVSNGDFCRFLGEWSEDDLTEKSPDNNGKSFLWSILDTNCRNRRSSVDDLWNEIVYGTTAIYVFECLLTKKLIAVDQSY